MVARAIGISAAALIPRLGEAVDRSTSLWASARRDGRAVECSGLEIPSGYVALAAALMRRAREPHQQPLFLIRGGVAVELPLGLRARATKDLDATARLATEELGPR